MNRLVMLAALWGAACGGSGNKREVDEPGATAKDAPIESDPVVDDEDDGASSDGITIANERGVLDEADINRVIEKHSAALQSCYTRNTGTTQYVGGRLELAFRVRTDGTVKSVRVAAGDLGSWPVEKCVLEEARGMSFPRPKGRGDADFSFPIDFPSRGSATALDEAQAQAELAPRMKELDACGAAGKVQVTVYIGIKGVVTSAGFAAGEALPEGWAACALAKAVTWKLTDPRGRVVKASSWTQP